MEKVMRGFILSVFIILLFPASGLTREVAPRISDKEIIERLTRLEEGQKAIMREMEKRFESTDKRFESIDKRFDQLINIFIGMIASFAAIVAVTIGFAIWDRRTALRPAIERADDIKIREERLESIVKEYAKVEPKMADILRSIGFL